MAERPLIGQGLFLANGRVANYQRVHTSQAMDTLTECDCLGISPAFPRVGGKPDHVSSQGKEAIFVTHDTLPRSLKQLCFIIKIKNIFTRITAYLHLLTISYDKVKLTSAAALRADKSNPPIMIRRLAKLIEQLK